MYGLFAGITTLDVAQLTAGTVAENQKVTSLDQMLAAGGPATNAAVVFARLARSWAHLRESQRVNSSIRGGNPGGMLGTMLVTAIGEGPAAHLILEDLDEAGVALVDCTDYDAEVPEEIGKLDLTPSLSTIMVNAQSGARTVASTNTRLPLKPEHAVATLEAMGAPQVLLVDGHNPVLAVATLTFGTQAARSAEDEADLASGAGSAGNQTDMEDANPFAGQEYKPGYLRILDGGSWKPWLPSILGYIDVAIISADFLPPGASTFEDTVAFLRGFGIERVIRTDGAAPVRWSWLGNTGQAEPPAVDAVCTLGAGDTFHGAFAWGCARGILTRDTQDPTIMVDFANRIASISTTAFGTRTWMADQETIDHELAVLFEKVNQA
ncbi:MAG: PfkB family carbohydrate kinase [Actinomycetaceae bacterium]|nr:PfkB family carbohydrate kinase [Actinomycetaceae bacterium]